MELITLDNGTRIALEPMKDAMSAAIHIFVACGSANETEGEEGAAHFVEHMMFKGSEHYTAKDIAQISDMYGGYMNAFTTKEYTCYHSRVLSEHIPQMLKMMCDMVCRPLFDDNAASIEKGVICEEIGMYEDSPDDSCYDLLDSLMWKGTRFAHPILGTRETVTSMNGKSLADFTEKNYTPDRIIISICGKFDRDAVISETEKSFGAKVNRRDAAAPEKPEFSKGIGLKRKKTEQTHIMIAFPGVSANDADRQKAGIFTEIVGGGVSSRLYMRIREELGLVYTVSSFTANYTNCGCVGIGGGMNPANGKRFFEETLSILDKMKDFSSEDELYRVKQQIKSALIMGTEGNPVSIASFIGKQLLQRNRYDDVKTALSLIDAVTEDDIRTTARRLFDPTAMAVAVYGSPDAHKVYESAISKYI